MAAVEEAFPMVAVGEASPMVAVEEASLLEGEGTVVAVAVAAIASQRSSEKHFSEAT